MRNVLSYTRGTGPDTESGTSKRIKQLFQVRVGLKMVVNFFDRRNGSNDDSDVYPFYIS